MDTNLTSSKTEQTGPEAAKPLPQENSKGILYSAGQMPPPKLLIFFAIQHALLIISLGIALPVTVSRSLNLDTLASSTFLSITLFGLGIAALLQSAQSRWLGSGYQSFAASDSAAITTCIAAGQIGGLPLIFGMTVFSGVLHLIISFFASKLQRVFTNDVTGTMIFILGISLVPTTMKNFLSAGSFAATGVFSGTALAVALATFFFMLLCSIYWTKMKLYAVLLGIIFGYVLALGCGVLNLSAFEALASVPLASLPLPDKLALSFDWTVVTPFLVITIAGLIDNIGDFTASQAANNGNKAKAEWSSIEKGIRACGLGLIISGLLGGSIHSTSTSSTGIAKATGVTSRAVAYLTGLILMVLSFFPRLIGILSIIPEPVLGAVLMFATCYIMASGFGMLSECELDDRRIFLIFVSIVVSASTLIPGLYSFLTSGMSAILVTPIVFGAIALIIMKLIITLEHKKHFRFQFKAGRDDIFDVNDHLMEVCKYHCLPKKLSQKLRVGVDALCEAMAEDSPQAIVDFEASFSERQFQLKMYATYLEHTSAAPSNDIPTAKDALEADLEQEPTTLSVTLLMLHNMFDEVKSKLKPGCYEIILRTDVE